MKKIIIKEQTKERQKEIANEMISLMKKGFDFGEIKATRDELHEK